MARSTSSASYSPLTTAAARMESLDFGSAIEAYRRILQQVQGQTAPQDLLAAARSDYARILAALYAKGHYSVVIRIRIDGREAAAIPALEAPSAISAIRIDVDPGPPFRFGTARVAPLASETGLPAEFRPGAPAEVQDRMARRTADRSSAVTPGPKP